MSQVRHWENETEGVWFCKDCGGRSNVTSAYVRCKTHAVDHIRFEKGLYKHRKDIILVKGSRAVVEGKLRTIVDVSDGTVSFIGGGRKDWKPYPSTSVHPVYLVEGECHLDEVEEGECHLDEVEEGEEDAEFDDAAAMLGSAWAPGKTMRFGDIDYIVLQKKLASHEDYVFIRAKGLFHVTEYHPADRYHPSRWLLTAVHLRKTKTRNIGDLDVANNMWLNACKCEDAIFLKKPTLTVKELMEANARPPVHSNERCTQPGLQSSDSKQTSNQAQKKEENTMTSKIVNTNMSAAKVAAYNEAGRLANLQATKVVSKALPMMARGYADTAFGRLVIANAANMAVDQFLPENPKARVLAQAMLSQAYQEVFQLIDVEGMLDSLMTDSKVAKALAKLNSDKGPLITEAE
jgi:hypothetical protein